MDQEKRFGAFSSSVDPKKLSETVEGIIKVVAGLAAYFGMSAVTPDIQNAGNQIQALILLGTQMAPLIYSAWNSATILFGLVRKIFVFAYDKLS